MFTYLYEVIFPYLGESFGMLSQFATITVDKLLYIFFSGVHTPLPDVPLQGAYDLLVYENLFTGQTAVWSFIDYIGINDMLPLYEILSTIMQPYLHLPVWVALVVLSMSGFIVFYLVKFLLR